jgi:hypothetical protein
VTELCGKIHCLGLELDPVPEVYLHHFTYFADQVAMPLVQIQDLAICLLFMKGSIWIKIWRKASEE